MLLPPVLTAFNLHTTYNLLQRAINTLWSVLEVNDLMWIPVFRSWRLNERHYGGLQVRDSKQRY